MNFHCNSLQNNLRRSFARFQQKTCRNTSRRKFIRIISFSLPWLARPLRLVLPPLWAPHVSPPRPSLLPLQPAHALSPFCLSCPYPCSLSVWAVLLYPTISAKSFPVLVEFCRVRLAATQTSARPRRRTSHLPAFRSSPARHAPAVRSCARAAIYSGTRGSS